MRSPARVSLLLLATLAGCSDSSGPDPIASVTVAPAATTLVTGATLPLTATLLDGSGRELTGREVAWATSNSGIAQVDLATGVVTGVTPGQATITASSGGRVGSASITVILPPVASVTVTPADQTLMMTTEFQMSVVARDSAGNVLTGRPVTWSSSDSTVVSVSATGLVLARKPGHVTVSATVGGTTGGAIVRVSTEFNPGYLRVDYPVGGSPAAIASGDLNGDGRSDLVTWNGLEGAGPVSILYRNAANTGFEPSVDFGRTVDFALADLNGDGRLDLVGGEGVSYRNPANTGFEPLANYAPSPFGTRSVAVGDVNGDGRLDVALAVYDSGYVVVLRRNAANTGFEAPEHVPVEYRSFKVAVGDLNGDGRADVVVTGSYFVLKVLYRNAANTGFDAPVTLGPGYTPTLADVNGDGRLDIVVGEQMYVRNAANSGFDAVTAVTVPINPLVTQPVAIGDLNGDGRLDLVSTAGELTIIHRNATNTGYDPPIEFMITGRLQEYRSVVVGDFNADGRLDIAVARGKMFAQTLPSVVSVLYKQP